MIIKNFVRQISQLSARMRDVAQFISIGLRYELMDLYESV